MFFTFCNYIRVSRPVIEQNLKKILNETITFSLYKLHTCDDKVKYTLIEDS